MQTIQTHTFPNGFRVIYEQPIHHMRRTSQSADSTKTCASSSHRSSHAIHKTDITHVNIFCRVGSVYETETTRGVSHFIEHMCFKGTHRLPKTRNIFEVYDDIGAYFNAYTEKQFTCYVSAFQDAHLQKCVSTLSDIMLNSTFNKREYEKELNVVIEENVNRTNDQESIVSDVVESMLYKGSAYSYPVDSLRYHKMVNAWIYDEVIDFYHKYYVPENMMLSIVSSRPFGSILKMLGKTDFTKRQYSRKSQPLVSPIMNTRPRMIITPQRELNIERVSSAHLGNTYISWGIRTCSIFSEDKHAFELLKVALGGKFTSRLNTLLRETHGLTYTSNVSTHYYEHSGDIIIYAVTTNHTLLRVAKSVKNKGQSTARIHAGKRRTQRARSDSRGVLLLIADMVRDLIANGITERELEHTKQYISGNFQLSMETSSTQTEHNGIEAFLANEESVVSYDKLYQTRIAPITRKQIHSVIRKYFTPENTNVAFVGGHLPEHSRLLKCCKRAFLG